MGQITWSDIARENLRDIYDYIANDSVRYAQKEILKIDKRVKVLHTFPESGKIVPEYEKKNWRELIEGNYRIVYQLNSDGSINIVSIHHHSKLLK